MSGKPFTPDNHPSIIRPMGLVIVLISCLFLSACALFSRYADFDAEKEGLVAVQTTKNLENRTETCFYVLAGWQRAMKTDSIQADEAVVYYVPHGCFESYIDKNSNSVRNRLLRVALTDEQGQPCDVPDIMEKIFTQIALIHHDLFRIRIFDLDGEYFVYVDLNVNLHDPNHLLYYHPEADALFYLFTFENEVVEQIQILSLERLHDLYPKKDK